ncbi:MAG: LPS assembly lipoprotein LptE [Rhizobiaceae bacterium]|nr:LPS assembly lipoprotein LptE [Rhizobiaceae bacterium]
MRSKRTASLAALALFAAFLSACTVRPLYSDSAPAAGVPSSTRTELASIAIKPVQTRYGQEVRNRLIFLFGGGQGEPASPLYSLNLRVTSIREAAAMRQVTRGENEPTAATITLTGSYVLTRNQDGVVIGRGSRHIMSSFDVPRQSFGEMRAEIDAQNRAARELAQLLQLAIAQDLLQN